MMDEYLHPKFIQASMMIGLIINILVVNYYVRQWKTPRNVLPATREYNRKAIWKHCLWGAFCAYESIPIAVFKIILLIVLFNVGMWKLVSHIRYRIHKRLELSTERERVPN